MKMVGKYILIVGVFAFLLYRGTYFKNLQDVRQQRQREAFNAAEYARDFWDNQLPGVLDKAVDNLGLRGGSHQGELVGSS